MSETQQPVAEIGDVTAEDCRRVAQDLREYGTQVLSEECGWLDAQVAPDAPGEDYASVCIWRFTCGGDA